MAAKIALSSILTKHPLGRAPDARSRASSRTLTPIGSRSDAGLEEIDTGSLTPPTPSYCYMRKTSRNGTAKIQQDTCQERDAFLLKAVGLSGSQPVVLHESIIASNVVLPEPVKTMMTITNSGTLPSKGSAGHPYTCGPACKYYRRKGACHDGADCTKCHQCQWSRDNALQKPVVPEGVPLRVQVLGGAEYDNSDGPASVGSIGHPFTCEVACKYQSKRSGCKDGKLCSRCHLCHWRRRCERMNNESEESKTLSSFESQATVAQQEAERISI